MVIKAVTNPIPVIKKNPVHSFFEAEPAVLVAKTFTQYRPKRPFVGRILNHSSLSVYLDQGKTVIYIPVTFCFKCSGADDGFRDGKLMPERKERTLKELEGKSITNVERAEYRRAYHASYNKGLEVRKEFESGSPSNKSRYREKR